MSESPKPEPEKVTITTLAYELHEIRKLIAWREHRKADAAWWYIGASVPMLLVSLVNFQNQYGALFFLASATYLLVGIAKRVEK